MTIENEVYDRTDFTKEIVKADENFIQAMINDAVQDAVQEADKEIEFHEKVVSDASKSVIEVMSENDAISALRTIFCSSNDSEILEYLLSELKNHKSNRYNFVNGACYSFRRKCD